MNFLTAFSTADWQSLASTLLHTLWQGAAVAVILMGTLRLTSTRRPNVRYFQSLAAVIAVVLAGFFTWAYYDYRQAQPSNDQIEAVNQSESPAPPGQTAAAPTVAPVNSSASSTDYRSLIIPIWLLGVGIMLFRLATSLRAADGLRRACQPASDRALTDQLDHLISKSLQREHHVRLMIADQLSSPIAMGFFWPVIILPASVASGTAPEMLRAILAHELAHIRRHDYLVNLGQMLVETILFFTPPFGGSVARFASNARPVVTRKQRASSATKPNMPRPSPIMPTIVALASPFPPSPSVGKRRAAASPIVFVACWFPDTNPVCVSQCRDSSCS
jgi:beta-lactamase regulating signal transducer with metallopeptidase domain